MVRGDPGAISIAVGAIEDIEAPAGRIEAEQT
jgi:hypothetical protein